MSEMDGPQSTFTVKPKMGKLIDADPFELGGIYLWLCMQDVDEKPQNKLKTTTQTQFRPIMQVPIKLDDKDMGMGYINKFKWFSSKSLLKF